jgi:HK97 family phage portal protein
MRIAAVYACVRVISETIATLPLHLYRREDDETIKRERVHHLAGLLEDEPNEAMTWTETRESLASQQVLYGNSFGFNEWRGGFVRRVWPLATCQMGYAYQEGYRPVYYYGFPLPGMPSGARLMRPDIAHFKALTADGWLGLSPIQTCRYALQSARSKEQMQANTFANGCRLTGILTIPNSAFKDDATRDKMRANWNNEVVQARTGAGTAILTENVKYQSISMSLEDAEFLDSQKFSVIEIARIFRVPPHKIQDLERATFCLPAGEPVFTEDGPQPVEKIRPGTRVWSRSDSGELRLSQVAQAGCSGVDEILTIRTTNRTLRCNAKHPVLCRRKILAPSLAVGGTVVDREFHSVSWETRYVPAGNLKAGDTIVCLDGLPNLGTVEACPTRDPSIGFMEFCGLLIGDGNLIENGTTKYVTIARAQGASYMDHYRSVIVSEFKKNSGGNGRGAKPVKKVPVVIREQERQTRFSSASAFDELSFLGFSGNARTKRVPGWVFRMPESHRLAFVRGFLDADGSVDKKGRISFVSVNPDMLSQIRHLCMGCGIPVTNLRCQKGATTLPNGKDIDFELWTFHCSDPGENRRIGSHTPLYVERMANGKPFARKGRKYPRYGGKGMTEEGVSLARISSIQKGPVEKVYDLEVKGTHSFIASGVVVHNSNIEHQSAEFLQDTILPWLVRIEAVLNATWLTEADRRAGYFLRHNAEGILRADFKTRMEGYARAIGSSIMAPNEARAKEMLPPYEGGDRFYVPVNMMPSDLVGIAQPDSPEVVPPSDSEPDATESEGQVARSREILRPLVADFARNLEARQQKAWSRIRGKEDEDERVEKFLADQALAVRNRLAPVLNVAESLGLAISRSRIESEFTERAAARFYGKALDIETLLDLLNEN